MPYEKTCCQKINETIRQHVCLLILILDTLCLVAASVRTHSFRDFMSCEASDPKLESWLSPTSPRKKKIANLLGLVKSARRRAGRIPPYIPVHFYPRKSGRPNCWQPGIADFGTEFRHIMLKSLCTQKEFIYRLTLTNSGVFWGHPFWETTTYAVDP